VLSEEGVTDAVTGILQTFVVTLYDSGNNRLDIGGDTLQVSISPDQTYIETFDNEDGSYLIKYRITLAGDFTLTVQVNLDSVNTKTSTITVVPNLAYASTSTLDFVTPVTLNIE
jgi:hypothetical protein